MNKAFTSPIELKSIGEDGAFTGYAATFGNVDKGDDLIIKGAFSEYLSEIGGNYPPVCWQHDMRSPIGITTMMREDDYGLYVEGKLLLEVQQAKEARILAIAKAIKGLSIGYITREREYNNEGIRILKKLGLYEYSFVTVPMNDQAQFTSVKTADLGSLRDCETYLREVCGLSRSEAKTFIARVRDAREADHENTDELMASLKTLQQTLTAR